MAIIVRKTLDSQWGRISFPLSFYRACMLLSFLGLLLIPLSSAHAATTNITPNGIIGDTTLSTALSELYNDDATCNPDTLSGPDLFDRCYTVDRGYVMYLSSFDTSAISAGAVITGAVLHVQYGAENGYSPTTAVVRYDNGGGLTTTGINPTDIT